MFKSGIGSRLSVRLSSSGIKRNGNIPWAARRLQKIQSLEDEILELKRTKNVDKGLLRMKRKEIGRLYRERENIDESISVAVATFFTFEPIANRDQAVNKLKEDLNNLPVLGTINIAPEGVNGGLSFPRDLQNHVAQAFRDAFGFDVFLNFAVEDSTRSPYLSLLIRKKDKALADGLDHSLDWSNCGEAIDAEAWHNSTANSDLIVLDCRNTYESNLGSFYNAIPLATETFRESWSKLDSLLNDQCRDQPIFMFCTGGIRCIKAGAYLKQCLGFADVRRLDGGIVAYERWLAHDAPPQTQSRFSGENFVFDRRSLPPSSSSVISTTSDNSND